MSGQSLYISGDIADIVCSWHEHDPWELIESVYTCIEEATKKFIQKGHKIEDIKAVGLTNQRETTLVWDSETGEPLHNAIAWPDTRTKGIVRELKDLKGDKDLSAICGLPLSTYPSSVKLVWLLRDFAIMKVGHAKGCEHLLNTLLNLAYQALTDPSGEAPGSLSHKARRSSLHSRLYCPVYQMSDGRNVSSDV